MDYVGDFLASMNDMSSEFDTASEQKKKGEWIEVD